MNRNQALEWCVEELITWPSKHDELLPPPEGWEWVGVNDEFILSPITLSGNVMRSVLRQDWLNATPMHDEVVSDGWLEWKYNAFTAAMNTLVEIMTSSGERMEGQAHHYDWSQDTPHRITHYRLIKPLVEHPRPEVVESEFKPITPMPVAKPIPMHELYPKYYRDVSKLISIDVYRVAELFGVTDSNVAHALKKLMLPGDRTGGKTFKDDVREARNTLTRRLEMWAEDETVDS